MPRVTDPALLQQLGTPAPGPVYSAPPKPPAGYGPSGMPSVSYQPGGPEDPAVIAAQARAKAEVDAQKEKDVAAYKAGLERQNEITKKALTPEEQAQKRMRQKFDNDLLLLNIARAREAIGKGGTGFGAVMSYLPESQARDLSGFLDTIRSNLTFDRLQQMRDESKTGGAVGNASDNDMKLLGSTAGSLDQYASKQKLLQVLDDVENKYLNFQGQVEGIPLDEVKRLRTETKRDDLAALATARPGAQNGGPGGGDAPPGDPMTFARGGSRTEPDPAMQGVNAHIRGMIGGGRSAQDIVGYMNSVQPGLGDQRAQDVAAAVAFRAKYPDVPLGQYPISVENREVPMSWLRENLNKAAQSPFGASAMGAADAASFGTVDNLTGNPALARAGMSAVRENNPLSSLAGNLTGGALAVAGLEGGLGAAGLARGVGALAPRALGGDLLYGAGYGAGSADDGNRLWGAGTGALTSAFGGALGRKGASAIGSAFTGARNPDVQLLRQRDVPMTVGQMAGGRLKAREDRLSGFGGIGDQIGARRLEGMQGFNRAAFDEGLAPIGVPSAGIGEPGMEAAHRATSGAYNNALDGVVMQADQPFMGALSAAQQRGRQITGELAGEFDNTMQARVGPFIDPNTGIVTGRNFQAIQQGLRKDRASLSGKPRYDLYADEVGNVEDAMRDMVQRQSPGTVPAFDAANNAYRNTSILQDAVLKGLNTDGIFTPAQLGQSARSNTVKFGGKRAAASTDRPFFDLQRAGQNVLPSKVPDSGTAGRIEAGDGIMGTLRAAARNAINAPLYSEALQPALARLLLDRSGTAVNIGRQIQRFQRPTGMFAAPLMLQYQGSGN